MIFVWTCCQSVYIMTTYHGDRARRLLIAELSANCATSGGGRNTSPQSGDKSTPSTRMGALGFSVSAIFYIAFFIFALKIFGFWCLLRFLFYLILGKNKIGFSDLKFGEVVCFSFPVSLRKIRASTTSPAHVFSDFACGFLSFFIQFFF